MDSYVLEAYITPNRHEPQGYSPRHNMVKHSKVWGKDSILNTVRKPAKSHLTQALLD